MNDLVPFDAMPYRGEEFSIVLHANEYTRERRAKLRTIVDEALRRGMNTSEKFDIAAMEYVLTIKKPAPWPA